jgi:phosphoribosylglycinamide formyltransferase-1
MSTAALPLVVLISGRGSNLQALIDTTISGHINATIVAVISNVPDAPGLERAAAAGIHTEVVNHTLFSDREQFDLALRDCIDQFSPELVVLAGFMRVLTSGFVAHFNGHLINIHPSLLPVFPGLDTHQRALQAGVHEHGVSIHFVTAQLDGGPVIAQAAVPVNADDDESSLAARVLVQEHLLLPYVVGLFAERRLRLMGDQQVVFDGKPIESPLRWN